MEQLANTVVTALTSETIHSYNRAFGPILPALELADLANESDLIRRFENDIEAAGVVGEKENAAITFLCGVSARLDKPLSLTVCGESSAGKNHLLGNVASFLPPEMVKSLTGLTPKALMHAEEDEFVHKAVFIAEYEGVKNADYAIRTFQSEREIQWDFVNTTSKNGIKKETRKVKGPAAFLQATTRSVLHPENETRLLFIELDTSAELTEQILLRQAERAAGAVAEDTSHLFQRWQDFIRSLEMLQVQIPFAPQLVPFFPTGRVRSRRDFPKLLGLIETSAYLHQHQREKSNEHILAVPADYNHAKRLFEHSFAAGPDTAVKELVDAARELGEGGDEFTVADIMAKTGWQKTKAYAVLKRAEDDLGCVAETENRGRYKFLRDYTVPPLELPDTVQ